MFRYLDILRNSVNLYKKCTLETQSMHHSRNLSRRGFRINLNCNPVYTTLAIIIPSFLGITIID